MIDALLRRADAAPVDARRHSRALAARLLATTTLGAGATALLWHWPVPGSYAAPGRLTIVCALLLLIAVSVPVVVGQVRRWRAASLAARVATAPAAIRETALFLQAEADLAWRGAPALLFAGLASGGLWLLAHWPQAVVLAPLRPVLAGLALGAGPLLVVQLVRRRRHLINVAYLRWCLAEQTGHAARQGVGLLRREGAIRGGWTVRPALETFVAGGFPWRLDDLFQNALVFGQPGSGKTVCVLNALLDGLLASAMSGPSTMRIADALDAGKILYVAMPLAVRPRLAMIVSTLVKLEVQNAVLRRVDKPRPSFFLCDEFQSFFTAGEGTGDSDFFQLSRQSRHANVVAAQNVSAFHKRTRNRDEVKNLFGNCAVKLFLRNTEAETNAFASALFGEVSMISVVPSEAAALDGAFRRTRTTYSRQARMVKAVPPETFTRLAIPVRGDPKRQHAESVVHLASRGETRRLDLDWKVWPL